MVERLQGRGTVSVIQGPSENNDYEGIVLFDDPQPYTDNYIAKISQRVERAK